MIEHPAATLFVVTGSDFPDLHDAARNREGFVLPVETMRSMDVGVCIVDEENAEISRSGTPPIQCRVRDLAEASGALRADRHVIFAVDPTIERHVDEHLYRRRREVAQSENRLPFLRIPLATIVPRFAGGRPTRAPIDVGTIRVGRRQIMRELPGGEGPILLEGETGTGKTETARLIHEITRPDGPFREQNCAALRGDEREAFFRGVVDNRYTGVRGAESIFVKHDGGSVLLDDFQDLAPHDQVTLLDMLNAVSNRVVGHKLGETAPTPGRTVQRRSAARRVASPPSGETFWEADVQVLIAINEPLAVLLERNRLRHDIHFRIRRRLAMTPLRQRLRDKDRLAAIDFARMQLVSMQERSIRVRVPAWEARGLDDLARFTKALNLLLHDGRFVRTNRWRFREDLPVPNQILDYDWPGNFRELENLAMALYEETGHVDHWAADQIIKAFGRQKMAWPTIEPAAETTSTDKPARMIALAYHDAITDPHATLTSAAAAIGVGARELRTRLLRLLDSRPRGSDPNLDELHPEERVRFTTAARRILAGRAV